MITLIPAEAVAALLILSVKAYAEEKGKTLTRARLSRKSILEISGRKQLKEAFINDVAYYTAELGWTLLEIEDGYALLKTDTAQSWTLISSSRAKEAKKGFVSGEMTIEELQAQAYDEDEEDELL